MRTALRATAYIQVMMLVACGGGDYEIPLRHGYFIARVGEGKFCVVDPERHVIILPSVNEYQVHGDVLIGRVSQLNSQTFFVLDMKTHKLESNLTARQFADEIRKRGIHDPSLRRPSSTLSDW